MTEGAVAPQEPGPPTQFSLDTGAGEAGPTICGTDLNFLMSADQLQGFIQGPGKLCGPIIDQYCNSGPMTGGLPAGIDPSLLTSAAFELVQASQALQAVQAVQPLLASDSPPLMTPLTQVSVTITIIIIIIIMGSCDHVIIAGPWSSLRHGPSDDRPSSAALPHPAGHGASGEHNYDDAE